MVEVKVVVVMAEVTEVAVRVAATVAPTVVVVMVAGMEEAAVVRAVAMAGEEKAAGMVVSGVHGGPRWYGESSGGKGCGGASE